MACKKKDPELDIDISIEYFFVLPFLSLLDFFLAISFYLFFRLFPHSSGAGHGVLGVILYSIHLSLYFTTSSYLLLKLAHMRFLFCYRVFGHVGI